MTQRAVEEEAGLGSSYVKSLESGALLHPTPHVLNSIARVLGFQVVEALRAIGYEIPGDKSSTSPRLDAAASQLSEVNLEVLTEIAFTLLKLQARDGSTPATRKRSGPDALAGKD